MKTVGEQENGGLGAERSDGVLDRMRSEERNGRRADGPTMANNASKRREKKTKDDDVDADVVGG